MQLQRRSRTITPEAQEWVQDLSRITPQAFGYSTAVWSMTLLAAHIRSHCRAAGHPSLAGLTYGALSRLLACVPDRVSQDA